jgi:hypothetical protein
MSEKVCARGSIISLYVSVNTLGTLVEIVEDSVVAIIPVA